MAAYNTKTTNKTGAQKKPCYLFFDQLLVQRYKQHLGSDSQTPRRLHQPELGPPSFQEACKRGLHVRIAAFACRHTSAVCSGTWGLLVRVVTGTGTRRNCNHDSETNHDVTGTRGTCSINWTGSATATCERCTGIPPDNETETGLSVEALSYSVYCQSPSNSTKTKKLKALF